MPTEYDVFAEIIEKSPCKPKDLSFGLDIYNHINKLVNKKWIKKTGTGELVPIKNKNTERIFKILKWSLKNNINFNIWFKKNVSKILRVLSNSLPSLNPKEISSNKENLKFINFLIENQFILIYNKKPKNGTLLNNEIFQILTGDNNFKINEVFLDFEKIKKLILKLKRREINPFEKKLFEFLAGSAQLEGSTITIGETIDVLTKNIYPEKPAEDIQMVKNLNESFNYIIEHLDEDITLNHIKEINQRCLFSLHRGAGRIRKTQNKIVGNPNFKTSNPNEIYENLNDFCNKFNLVKTREEALNDLGFIHNEFQRIHPFSDGNSRTTRLIVNWFLMKQRLPILILKNGSFEKYMSLTKLSDERNDNLLRDFLLHVIYHEEIIK